MKVIAIIPARYESVRFPGKPLADIHGKPMIQRVYENVKHCRSVDKVLVATDDERIRDCVLSFGGDMSMTSTTHRSGTDRIAEAVNGLDSNYDIVLNVQGDEPGIKAEDLDSLIDLFQNDRVDIATLVTPFKDLESFQNPNRVKAVIDSEGKALYFTRAAAPFDRNNPEELDNRYQHVGIYAFRNDVLTQVTQLSPSPLEVKESLEQLRWLENGYAISAAIIKNAPFGIDTPEDLTEFLRTGLG